MKTLVLLGVVLAVALAAFWFMPSKTVYMNPEIIEKEVEVPVNLLDEQIKKRNEELEELYRKAQNLEASIDVRKAEVKRLEALNVEDQKELASFIQAIASKK
jgi:uncharacterized membrane protein YgaE (UPF0421/DUF939 family)